ncbi:GTPase family protein [Blautia massiliensis (ex Durand et al. 2017)]|uniref:GTPase family protein n=1 Tax=Blautia massiliensis (ex Durand et al. 2017) TaxID=1737424 RepID=UPI0022E24609|nr:GTPase [Blautia massiliensis (ex Durand et al. 2017)]
MEFNANDVAKKIMDAIQKEYKELETLNVMILGKTGVGKSTLINNMFNKKMADVGVGKPITKDIKKITLPDFPLAIFDTPGLELSGDFNVDSLMDAVVNEIDKGIRSGDVSQAIHCIWYCISTPSHRIEQTEIDFLKKFLGKTSEYDVPVIVVLTQSYSKRDAQKLKSEVEKENLPIVNVVPVLAENYEIDDEYTAKAYGLERLSEVMNNVIPDAVQKTFIAVQKVNLELKKGKAQAVVASSAVAAAATGAVPIPFSDAAVLVPEQIAMIGGITAIFGVPMDQGTVMAIISATIGTAGTTVLGKTIAANLIKLIPAVGSVVGGVISAATAAALTAALGEAYIAIMVMVCKGDLSITDLKSEKGKAEITRIFTEQLKVKRDKNGEPIE